MQQTVDVYVVYVYSADSRRVSADSRRINIFCVRLLHVCSFNYTGHSRASSSGTSNEYGSHAIFFYNEAPEHALNERHTGITSLYDIPLFQYQFRYTTAVILRRKTGVCLYLKPQ